MAISGTLATINILMKIGLIYSEAKHRLWRHNGFVLNTVLGLGVWDAKNYDHS